MKEEDFFLETVKQVHFSQIPSNVNKILSHVLYRLKMDDDKLLMLKARISPHGNEDSFRFTLQTDCCLCSPIDICYALSYALVYKWKVTTADMKSAFFQTGNAQRGVYVILPRDFTKESHFWIILAAQYGLVNAIAKWQSHSDVHIKLLQLNQVAVIPKRFFKREKGQLVLLVANIVGDLLITDENCFVETFRTEFDSNFTFGTVVHGPVQLSFFVMIITQHEDLTSSGIGDVKLDDLNAYPWSLVQRR